MAKGMPTQLERPSNFLAGSSAVAFQFHSKPYGIDLAREVDQKIGRFLSEPIAEIREQILDQIEKLLKETPSISFLVHLQVETSFHPSLQGVRLTTHGWVTFKDLWYKSDAAVQFLTTNQRRAGNRVAGKLRK